MMGTRAAAFAGKISNLRESILRIHHGTMPQPTCIDLANMLKYFCQVFNDLRDFKDIENITLYANEKKDQVQLIRTLPNFDYSGLYKTLAQLVDVLPLNPQPSNGYEQLCENLLSIFKCLVPLLDQANMETMPYLVTTLFMSFPLTMHKSILDTLCFNLLPFTIDQQQRNTARMLRKANERESAGVHTDQQPRAFEFKSQGTGRNNVSSDSGDQGPSSNQKSFHFIVRIEDSSETSEQQRNSSDGGLDLDRGGQSRPGKYSASHGVVVVNREDYVDQGIDLECNDEQHSALKAQLNDDHDNNDQDSASEDEYALLSVTGILMVSFHYIQEPMHHSQLVECLMKLKSNVFENLLYVIAYGTTRARCPAVEILFRYWPDICPSQADRKQNQQSNGKLKHIPWQPTKCQNRNCSFTTLDDDEAVKMCLDFKISITLSGLPPPMLVCLDCVDSIYKQQLTASSSSPDDAGGVTSLEPADQGLANTTKTGKEEAVAVAAADVSIQAIDDHSSKFIDLLLPMERISKLCENKKCRARSNDRSAIGTCFDIECANYNGKKPIRYCRTCFVSIHEPCESNNYDMTLQNHIRHSSLNLNIMDSDENVNNFVEAIISLLKEAAPAERPSKDSERYLRSLMGPMSQFSTDNKDMNTIATEEKQLISQYGIWLMTGLCKSVERLSDELLGRLLGMLFQWFHFTACLPDDQAGSALEKLKGECIKGWIMEVKNKRLDVFISCLLPHPIDCSKIGGHWEVWPDNAHQIKEGFKRLLCLVPYDIITDDVWDEIMPHWMECFRHEVPENELSELKILLSKVFDPELSPLGFETKQMYNFISSRFEDASITNQEQTLYWLQIITMLEIPIPINFLYQMLRSGVKSLAEIRSQELTRLEMVSKLNDLNAKASRHRKRRSNRHQTGSDSEDGSGAGSDYGPYDDRSSSSGESQISDVVEDDVLLPDSGQQNVSRGEQQTTSIDNQPLTRQERQAQARAAFSAKLHATMLEAQRGTDGGLSQSTSSTPLCLVGTPAGQLSSTGSEGAATQQQQQQPTKSYTLGCLTPSAVHAQPLKSTSSSASGPDASEPSKPPQSRTTQAGSSRTSQKPKLKLNLDSMDDGDFSSTLSRIDNNLVCYILMMDILLKQLDLQEISSHRGLDSREAQQAIELLNSIISTPWLGKHTCCDSLPYTSSGSPTAATAAGQQSVIPSATTNQNQNTFSTSSMKQTLEQTGASNSKQPDDSNRQDALYSNIHSFSHCAQGFEHEDSYETCVFCEIISTFFQLSMSLVEFFSPVIEVSICEVSQDAANGEFNGRPDYSRIGLDHLGPSPKDQEVEFDFQQQTPPPPSTTTNETHPNRLQHQQDPTSPFSPSYFGPTLKQEVLDELPKELQLSYNLLVQFHQYQTPDIVSQLLQMIKLISLHSQVLSKASKLNPQFISWCQHNMLVSKLWSLCQLESSEIARTCVPLLLHCITLPWGVRLFRDLVERDFNSDSWLSRFRAVERVVTIAYFCEPSTIKNSTLLQSTMASAFCYVVRCLDDIEAIVAQRALVSLEMMKTSSLKLLLWCLEVQFDYIMIDRSIILRSVFQLYNHLRDRRFLTWEFFLNRFDTIFLEAQIYLQQTGEIPSFTMQDLKNTNTKSEIYQKKIARAKEALQETHHSRSLSHRFQENKFTNNNRQQAGDGRADELSEQQYKQSVKMQQQMQGATGLGADLGSQAAAARQKSGQTLLSKGGRQAPPSPMRRVLQHGRSISSRYQSVAYLTSQSLARRKNSKFMSNLAMQSVPPLMSLPDKLHQHLPNSFVDDGSSKLNEIAQENHVFGVVHRVCDEDRDTNHSLIFLLMQFFSKPDPSHPQSVKTLNRSHQIVLRHLNILMGFSVARKNFLISASNLRLLPVFNAFLTSLPKVLDFNYTLGGILLDTCLPVLIYCPATDNVQFDQLKRPIYSLWLLNPLMRQSWLMSVMTFLYKYQFNQPHLKDYVNQLVWIIINTLESHLNIALAEVVISPATPAAQAPLPSSTEHHRTTASTTKTPDHQHHHQADDLPAADLMAAKPNVQDHKTTRCEAIELQSVGTESSPTTAATKIFKSSSGGSGSMATNVAILSSSQQQFKTPYMSTESTAAKPAIAKAETTDNLINKTKFFQRKDTSSSNVQQRMSPSAKDHQQQHQISGSALDLSSNRAAQQQQASSTSASTSAVATTATSFQEQTAGILQRLNNEERLLPIGIQQQQLPGSAHQRMKQTLGGGGGGTSQSVERLLPIGYAPTISQVLVTSTPASTVTSTSQIDTEMAKKSVASPLKSAENIKSTSAEQTPAVRPLQGLKGNMALIGCTTGQSTSTSAIDSPMKSPQVSGGQKSMIEEEEAHAEFVTSQPVLVSSKAARLTGGRFGTGGKQSASDTKLSQSAGPASEEPQTASHTTSKSSTLGMIGGRKSKFVNKFHGQASGSKEYVPKHQSYAHSSSYTNNLRGSNQQQQPSFSSPSLLNEQLAQLNRHSFVQEFSDKDLSMCLVILETFIHHEPSMAAQMLPNILRLVARYSSASFESWQTGSNAHLVGGSMFVARQFIRVALHDLMENNIFHQIFTSHFTGYEFYKSMSTALADFADLNQLAPLSKLFEDLNKQKNLPPLASLMTILENVATYFECITQEGCERSQHSQATWNQFIINWENFLRKLILALPRYSGNWTIDHTRANVIASPVGVNGTGQMAGGKPQVGMEHSSNLTARSQSGPHQTGSAASGAGLVVGDSQSSSSGQNNNKANSQSSTSEQPDGSSQLKHHHQPQQQNPSSCSMIMAPIMRIILATTKVSHLASCKTIVDPYSKIISYTVCNSQFKYEHLLEINHNCCRLYTRDREKYLIQRQIAYELVQVLKCRFFILEENLLLLLLFVLQDVGGTLPTKVLNENLKIDRATMSQADSYITNASECLRQHMGDLLEFITDVHAISRINENLIGSRPSSINRDSFGGHVKAAISQYLALEISLSHSGDQRTIARYLPWLYNSPSLQQGPREFIDCVSHIRQLSWLILGSLQHSALVRDQHSATTLSSSSSSSTLVILGQQKQLQQQPPGAGGSPQSSANVTSQCQPIPIEKNNNIAEHVQVILAGFAEQSKESVLHMSGLFHAFLLCQLWTMYCENICSQHAANSEQYQFCQSTLDDFWAKITPGVLRLVGHSRVMSEMVSTHFLQLIESLIESNSSILIRYLPMWNSVFYSYKRRNKSSNLAIRLQKCIEWQPPDLNQPDIEQNQRRFINWLEKVQYKMSHIEIQSAQAAPFYLS